MFALDLGSCSPGSVIVGFVVFPRCCCALRSAFGLGGGRALSLGRVGHGALRSGRCWVLRASGVTVVCAAPLACLLCEESL